MPRDAPDDSRIADWVDEVERLREKAKKTTHEVDKALDRDKTTGWRFRKGESLTALLNELDKIAVFERLVGAPRGQLLRRLGAVSTREGTREAILSDLSLTGPQRQILRDLYDLFTKPAGAVVSLRDRSGAAAGSPARDVALEPGAGEAYDEWVGAPGHERGEADGSSGDTTPDSQG